MSLRLANKYDGLLALTCRTEIIPSFFYLFGDFQDLAIVYFLGQITSLLFWNHPQYDWKYYLDTGYHFVSVPYSFIRSLENTYGLYEYFLYLIIIIIAFYYAHKPKYFWVHGVIVHCFGNVFIPVRISLMPSYKFQSLYIATFAYLSVTSSIVGFWNWNRIR